MCNENGIIRSRIFFLNDLKENVNYREKKNKQIFIADNRLITESIYQILYVNIIETLNTQQQI